MFKIQNLLFAATIVASVSFGACHKHDHDHDEDDTTAPVLTISSPATDAVVNGEVQISGRATDESMHEMEIKVTKDSDGSELFSATPSVHDKTDYTIDQRFTPSGITAETAVTLTISVSDHSEHTTTQTVKFKLGI